MNYRPKNPVKSFPQSFSAQGASSYALETWLKSIKPQVERSIFIDYKNIVRNHLIPAFGDLKLSELTRTHVKDWAAEKDASRKRIANMLSPLRQMLAEAVDAEKIPKNPLHG